VFTVFGDESHDEKTQRIFAVSGIGGTQAEWDALEVRWLNRTNGIPFHSSDCDAGRGDFAEMDVDVRRKLYRDLVSMLVTTNMLGYVVVTSLEEFYSVNPHTNQNAVYHHCFVKVIMHFAEMGFQLIPREKVGFVFDLNTQTNFASGLLYDYMSQTDGWSFGAQLDRLSFASRRNSVGIQVADLVAREFMKHCDNFYIGPRKYKRARESFKALSRSMKYRGEYEHRDYWQHLKAHFTEIEKKTGITRKGYVRWLDENNLKDSQTNVHRYLIRLDELKAKGITPNDTEPKNED